MHLQPILLIEDSPEDFEATMRRLRRARLANPLIHCTDGDSALDYLHRRGDYANAEDAPRPGIVLLDLHLPGTDGLEVLAEIKHDPDLRDIPVVVLSSSADERDIQRCYAQGANGHVGKPVDLLGLVNAIAGMQEYGIAVSVFPMAAPDTHAGS